MKYHFNNIGELGKDIFFEGNIRTEKIFLTLFNSIPNDRTILTKIELKEATKYFKEKYKIGDNSSNYRHIQYFRRKDNAWIIDKRYQSKRDSRHIFILGHGLIVCFSFRGYSIFFDENQDPKVIDRLQEELIPFLKKNDNSKKANFHMIVREYDSFELKKYKVKGFPIQPELHYNDDFTAFDKSVNTFLSDKNKTGLILMHGESGTGKTTYIRHLIKTSKKKFIFLPLFMASSISNPEFLPFLTEQKNSVIIIEDSEKLIKSRESGEADTSIATLLNMSDGLLSDALGIKLICTFNTNLDNIDKALLRKGRLVNRYEFKKLTIEKASKIASKYKLPYDAKEPISLGDLFNIEEENSSGSFEKKKIGF